MLQTRHRQQKRRKTCVGTHEIHLFMKLSLRAQYHACIQFNTSSTTYFFSRYYPQRWEIPCSNNVTSAYINHDDNMIRAEKTKSTIVMRMMCYSCWRRCMETTYKRENRLWVILPRGISSCTIHFSHCF